MGDRIAFRGRGRGCIVASGDAVSMVEPRVKFVRKEVGEVGDGTMLVTREQLEEVIYRVRDSTLVSGGCTLEVIDTREDPLPTRIVSSEARAVAAPSNLVEMTQPYADPFSGMYYSIRGYVSTYKPDDSSDDRVPMPEIPESSLGEAYDVGDYFFDDAPSPVDGITRIRSREANAERGIWASESTNQIEMEQFDFDINTVATWAFFSPFTFFFPSSPSRFRTGFSQLLGSAVLEEGYGVTTKVTIADLEAEFVVGTETQLNILSTVAWVGSDDPLSPGNSLYLRIIFTLKMVFLEETTGVVGEGVEDVDWITLTTIEGDDGYSAGADLVLKLAGDIEIRAPLFFRYPDFVDRSVNILSCEDWVFEATQWWPYATNSGAAAYDADTGLPINGGSSA